ncbi:MAG TPA: hypothetical protein VLA04_04955 [Verrucomicrobiae bacterium]|nr:hypothetical protein [Verrucomicrobiae bacterium]
MPEHKISPILLGGLAIVIVAGALTGYQYYKNNPDSATPTPSPTATAEATATPAATATPVAKVTDANVTWLSKPEKLASAPAIFDKGEVYETAALANAENIAYKVGTDGTQDIILMFGPALGLGGTANMTLLKTGASSYDLIKANSSMLYDDNGKYEYELPLKKGAVTENATKKYASITEPEKLTVDGVTADLSAQYFSQAMFDFREEVDGAKRTDTKIDETPYGDVYHETNGSGDTVYSALVLRRFDGLVVYYDLPRTFITDDSVLQATWKDGKKNSDTFRIDGSSGCGHARGITIIASGSLDGLAAVGTTSKGETLYGFTDNNNAIVKSYYEAMNGEYYDQAKGDNVKITVEEWQAKHGLVVYKDGLNRLVVITNTTYGVNAECGKPVVYLYPTETTPVSVKVGANVTVSEPAYNNGWNVTAHPNGTLVMGNGAEYPNLFWEGTGHGSYPEITKGFVVKTANIEATLRDHLKQLGLNAQETADFLEFWMPEMPTTPYTRVSWLNTREMDELAPLTVSPKPDTSIRVFLDYEGLEVPIALPAQKLSAVPRHGFTLVEWGGLLRR